MLYTPMPGTPLHAEHRANGTLLSHEECPDADTHGQLRFNYRHPRIKNGEETEYLLRAFRRDFEVNGPSVDPHRAHAAARLARPEGPPRPARARPGRVRDEGPRRRSTRERCGLPSGGSRGANPALAARLRATRHGIEREFGWKARLAARVVGPVVLATLWREERRLRRGRTYEPPTFYEANPAAAARARGRVARGSVACRWVEPPAARAGSRSGRLIGRLAYSRRPSQRDEPARDSFFEVGLLAGGQVLLVVHEAPEDLALRPGQRSDTSRARPRTAGACAPASR